MRNRKGPPVTINQTTVNEKQQQQKKDQWDDLFLIFLYEVNENILKGPSYSFVKETENKLLIHWISTWTEKKFGPWDQLSQSRQPTHFNILIETSIETT